MKKILIFLLVTAVSLGLFLGVRAAMININNQSNPEKEIEENNDYVSEINIPLIDVRSLNPIINNNKYVSDVLKIIYEPLIDINYENKLIPCLSTEWAKIDENNWVIKTRKNVKWHDDTEFSADDVGFTIDKIKEAESSSYKFNVENILSYSIIDTDSIKITLKESDNLFPYKLTFPIIPKHYFRDVELNDEDKANRPIGTGSYKYYINNFEKNRIELVKNINWWNFSNSKLEKIYLYKYGTYGEAIKAFKSSEIDIIITSMIDWNKKFGTIGINTYKYENSEFETIIPNAKRTIFSDSSVRRALLYAINREKILLDVYNDNVSIADIPIHNTSWLFDSNEYTEYDTEKSKQLLINSGWKQENGNSWSKKINNQKFILKASLMVNSDNEERCKVANIIKENLSELGISITINKVDWSTYKKNLETGNFDLALGGFDIVSEFDIIHLLSKDGKLNYAGYENDTMEDLFSTIGLGQINLESTFKSILEEYRKEVPYIGLYFKTNILITNKSVDGEITPSWWNVYNNISSWSK